MANVKLSNVIRRAQTKVDKDDTDLVFYVGGEHIESENIRVHSRGIIVESTIGPMFYYGFKAGDFLLVSRNPHLKKAGLVDFDGICSEKTFVLETANSDVLLPEFLPFVLQNERFWDYAYRHRHGSTNTFINWSTLANYEFELPDLETQRKLAEVLWSINDTMEAYKNLISATDELVKSQFIDMFGEPKNSPDAVSFETAFTIRDDLRKPINDAVRSEMHTGQLYPYYGANGQVDSINDYLMDCDAICLAEDCGAYGAGEHTSYIVSGKCWVNNHAHVLIPKECCDIEFANVYFRILDMTEYVTGTTRLKLTQAKMKTLPMILPSLELQREFADFVRQSDKSKYLIANALISSSNQKQYIGEKYE
jgi:type I restriction enzyme S subunit